MPTALAPRARRGGFTLIELLVVIAIIALLVSILLPSLNQAREAAKTAVCTTNLRNFGTMLVQYGNDWSDYVVPAFYGYREGPDDQVDDVTEKESWQTIYHNLGLVDAPTSSNKNDRPDQNSPFLCPGDNGQVSDLPFPWPGDPEPTDPKFASAFPHRSTTTGKTYYLHSSYGISADTYWLEHFPFNKIPQDNTGRIFLRKLGHIKRLGGLAGIYDGWHVHRGWGWYTISARHNNRTVTNVMRMDGSAGIYKRAELPLERFERSRYIGARTLRKRYPALLWRMDQLD